MKKKREMVKYTQYLLNEKYKNNSKCFNNKVEWLKPFEWLGKCQIFVIEQ